MIANRRILLTSLLAAGSAGALTGAAEGFAPRQLCQTNAIDSAAVERHFNAMIGEDRHPGAQLAIARHGELAAHFCAGRGGDGRPVDRHSLIGMLSTTKLLATLVMLHLHDEGYFAFDDRVSRHWPGFAANGKGDITIAQVMSHRAGLAPAAYAGYADWREWDRPGGTERLMEKMSPVWPPGSANGYHAHTFGHVIECLVRRWTGLATGEVLRQRIANPAGFQDVYIGLPPEALPRYAPFFSASRTGAPNNNSGPPGGETHFFNSPLILHQSLPWGGGVANAGDLALLLQVFVGRGSLKGRAVFTPATCDIAATPTNAAADVDRVIRRRVRWGMGAMVGQSEGVGLMRGPVFGRDAPSRTIGHLGGSSAMVWADPDIGTSVAFLSTQAPAAPRYSELSDAIRSAMRGV